MSANVLILGGGFGGWVAANKIRNGLPEDYQVTVIDRNDSSCLGLSLLWLMTGDRNPDRISRSFSSLERKGISFVRGDIDSIDPKQRDVVAGGETFSGDYLVVALGAELAPETIPGLQEGGHNCYTLSGADALRHAMANFSGGRIVVLTAAPGYKCPAAPYEAAILLEDFCRSHDLRGKTQIGLYAAEPGPMGVAGPAVSQAVRKMIESKGIVYHPEHQVVEVDPGGHRIHFSNGVEAGYDLLCYVPPHRAPRAVRESPLIGASGWVEVDRHTMATRFERVYLRFGGCRLDPAETRETASEGRDVRGERMVARNVIRDITGKGEAAAYDGRGECYVETGDGLTAYGEGRFYEDPVPNVTLHSPSSEWNDAKIRYEKEWLEAGIRADED
ncbi:MAG: FAD-dependent pyridine nucleotide-disulfide oxidoreductase, partial [Deltaproteobacteria bacterium]|nr:FAD-dependent pyridine nucleotide-disulfide oxidoreductase [Deltaproteobacteria bacterium]